MTEDGRQTTVRAYRWSVVNSNIEQQNREPLDQRAAGTGHPKTTRGRGETEIRRRSDQMTEDRVQTAEENRKGILDFAVNLKLPSV
jgi:hypothetical protein